MLSRSVGASTSSAASTATHLRWQSTSTERVSRPSPCANSTRQLHHLCRRDTPRRHRQDNACTQPQQCCRLIHTTARRADYYGVLQVDRNASKKEIKAQFYKLSKQYHPDVNPGDGAESAKTRFQEVSEAWSTLGDDRSRREYDRRLSPASTAYNSGPGGHSYAYRHDSSDNTQRRARATYAWDYQRRRGDSPRARRASYHQHGGGGAGEASGDAAHDRSVFEQLAAQQRRREAAASARAGSRAPGSSVNGSTSTSSGTGGSSADENVDDSSSSLVRFCQIAGIFSFVLWVGLRPPTTETVGSVKAARAYKNEDRATLLADQLRRTGALTIAESRGRTGSRGAGDAIS